MPENRPLKELISLEGRGAIMTGGAMGIGLAICRRLAEAGARVLIADLDAGEAQKASEELKSCGYHASYLKCDVAIEEQVKAMIAEAVGILGSIDILVNNAGIYPRKPLDEMTGRDFEAVHPSSTGMSAYGASKGGVLMLTKSMARELGPHGIRVNAIAPGGIKTRGVLSQTGGPRDRAQLKELKSFISRIALDRMGDADDIARVALFLASDLSAYITGDLIVADGGYLVS